MYITAYMQGTQGVSRSRHTTTLPTSATILVVETNVYFIIMEPGASDIFDLDDERVRSAVNSDYICPL